MRKRMIEIFYTHFRSRLPDERWKGYICIMPGFIRERINRYKRWQDRQRGLLGKLLLLEGLKGYGYRPDCLSHLLPDENGKPFLDDRINFNISHSDEYIVCTLSDEGKVGIDIERIKEIDLSDFRNHLTYKEREVIAQSQDPYGDFYRIWTIKESVLKAAGRGLSASLLDVDIEGTRAVLDGRIWFLNEIRINPGYTCHVASEFPSARVFLRNVNF
jgi:4'-phosphopantetheinyl transferase